MSYEDFVWFILSEEDKSNELSLEYWFRCVDLDCDGRLRPNEMLVWLAGALAVSWAQPSFHRRLPCFVMTLLSEDGFFHAMDFNLTQNCIS